MAPLPRERITKNRVFAKSGVDLCGPFMIRSGLRRVTPIKLFVALFVCLVTRAIHLELVRDLSSDAFLAAFFRFISRRGQCAKLFSDKQSLGDSGDEGHVDSGLLLLIMCSYESDIVVFSF